jgi:RNA recognition motif-containing protein
MKIVVGNLSFRTTKAELKGLFARHGDVARVRLAAVVTMPDTSEATKAVKALRGHTLQGRVLVVRELRSRASGKQGSPKG